MSIQKQWACRFKDGAPLIEDQESFEAQCHKYEGKQGYVSLKLYRKQKSNPQQRYYRGVFVKMLADHLGYDYDDMHSAISMEHLLVVPEDGSPPYVMSTQLADWTTDRWERYMAHLRRWALDKFGVVIPEPNEIDMDQVRYPF